MGKNKICSYCGTRKAPEEDHVVARQFFPKLQKYRNNLPKVPSCGICNRNKQKIEDIAGVYFQFGHSSEATNKVFNERVYKTLDKNQKLTQSLRTSLQKIWVKHPPGLTLLTPVLKLNKEMLTNFRNWFQFLAKGLYFYETGNILPKSYTLHLIKPTREEFWFFRDMIIKSEGYKIKTFAEQELKYMYAISSKDNISVWVYSFKSIEVIAIIIPSNCNKKLTDIIRKMEWN